MNLPHKKPGAIHQSFTQQTERARQTVRQPVAPAVYRPQAKPNVMQQKAAGSHVMKTHPSAPPVYRPQPIAKALQAKMVGSQPPHQKQMEHRVAAPPVYRPQQQKLVQPKVAATAQTRMPVRTSPQTSLRPAQQTPAHPGSLKSTEIRSAAMNRNLTKGTSIQRSIRTNLPAPALQLKVAQAKSGPMFSTRMGSRINGGRSVPQGAAVIQRQWVAASPGVEKWDVPLDGVTWYADDGGDMWFEITHEAQVKKGNIDNYRAMAGAGKKQSWEAWQQAGAPIHDEVSAMMELAEAKLEWGQASYRTTPPPFQKQPFYQWLFKNKEEPNQMNCWEAVLYSACKSGVKDKAYIKKAVEIVKADEEFSFGAIKLVRAILKAPAKQMKRLPNKDMVEIPKEVVIPRGHVVLFGEDGQHVALSTGTVESEEHGVLELDKKTGGVVRATVEEIMRRNSAYRSLVTWGPLPAL